MCRGAYQLAHVGRCAPRRGRIFAALRGLSWAAVSLCLTLPGAANAWQTTDGSPQPQNAARLLSLENFAQSIAAEPQPFRLRSTNFLMPASLVDDQRDATLAFALEGQLGATALPSETSADESIELATPPDGPRRQGFFARVFGPGIEAGGELLSDVPFDYRNFYSPRGLLWLGGGIGVAAIMANTQIDQNFQSWYQDDVRSPASDRLRDDIAWLGEGQIMIPIWLASGFLITPLEEHSPAAHVIGAWGRSSTRAFLVGAPMLLALQYGLGAHRPNENLNSYWHPFRDSHGASGDAWIGAISFMTAAKMTDSRLAKVALYSLALFPAWGRVNVDAHYLSQVTLGVWLAALSVEAVDLTDRATRVQIVPSAGPGTMGASLLFRW